MPTLPPVKQYRSNTGVQIYRIPCQVFEALSGRVYLLLGAGPPTLLDTGSGLGASTRHILAGIDAVRAEFGENIRVEQIGRIIISHGHVDHVGGLPDFVRLTAAEVAVHELDYTAVAAHRQHIAVVDCQLNRFFRAAGVEPARRVELRRIFCAMGKPIEDVAVSRRLSDGDDLDGLRIIHTPGHSPGHVCLGVGDVLLAADHILAQTIPQQWPESALPFTGLAHYLDSLDKVRRMPGFNLTLAAHEPAIRDVYGRIESIRAAHARRLDRLLAALRAAPAPLSVAEIARRLYPESTGVRAVLAITDVGSRVEYLHQRGLLAVANFEEARQDEDAPFKYSVV